MAHVMIKVKGREIASLNMDGPTVVGRAADCRICIQDTLMSRHHFRLQPGPNKWTVIDLSSANGTRVDGERIQRHELSDGDLLEAGHITMIFFEDSLAQGGSADNQIPLIIGEKVLAGDITMPTAAAGGSLSGGPLSGGSLSEGSLSAGSLSGGISSSGTLSSGTLSGGTLSGGSLSGGSVSGGSVSGGSVSGRSVSGRSVSGQSVSGRSVSGASVATVATAPQVTASTSDTNKHSQYMPEGVSKRGETWEELAKAHAAPRTQPPTVGERLNKLPRGVAIMAIAITGIICFAIAFYLTNLIAG